MEYTKTAGELCELIWSCSDRQKDKIDIIIEDAKKSLDLSEAQMQDLRKYITLHFMSSYKRAMKIAQTKQLFRKRSQTFMEKVLHFTFTNKSLELPEITTEKNKGGRPRKSFDDCKSAATKYKIAAEIASQHSVEALTLALRLAKKKSGVIDADVAEEADYASDDETHQFTNEKALASLANLKLSKDKYLLLRRDTKDRVGEHIYPAYSGVLEAKKDCYPEYINVTQVGASVNIIALIEHTIKRIMMTVDEEKLKLIKNQRLHFHGKWGMDGASGQQTTRQQYSPGSDDKEEFSDQAVFFISFCPLLLQAGSTVLWTNPKPNSTDYCRPIAFSFEKETDDLVTGTYHHYLNQINKIELFCFEFEGKMFEVDFNIRATMFDGKILNILAKQKSSTSCYLCRVTPKNMNDITFVANLKCFEHCFALGLSTLHSWIRCMEYLLHISYKLDCDTRIHGEKVGDTIQKIKLSPEERKCIKKENEIKKADRKRKIQMELKAQLNLTVDVVKQGAGTTNTGNVARTFFRAYQTVSKIIGVDMELMKRLYVILQVISCNKTADFDEFKEYCLITARMCVDLYWWYKMTPTVHKVLIHGSDIMRALVYPPGWYSEEPQEASHKIFRELRLKFSRMYDRKKTNEDIIHYLLILSDPFISTIRKKNQKKINRDLCEEAEMLVQ